MGASGLHATWQKLEHACPYAWFCNSNKPARFATVSIPDNHFAEAAMARLFPLRQCQGRKKSGERCAITSTSNLVDHLIGQPVAEPLRNGGAFCWYHMKYFETWHLPNNFKSGHGRSALSLTVFFFDLETTGLSLKRDHIVEIGIYEACTGSSFCTVVQPEEIKPGSAIHGIHNDELLHGPSFATAFKRMLSFMDHITDMAVSECSSSSSDDEFRLPRVKSQRPQILLVAHNGAKFDFPMLISECWRHGLCWDILQQWLFVDTLDMLHALSPDTIGGCAKLQCLSRFCSCCKNLQAHRALDDAVALHGVLEHLSCKLGIRLQKLFEHCLTRLDAHTAAAAMAALHGHARDSRDPKGVSG